MQGGVHLCSVAVMSVDMGLPDAGVHQLSPPRYPMQMQQQAQALMGAGAGGIQSCSATVMSVDVGLLAAHAHHLLPPQYSMQLQGLPSPAELPALDQPLLTSRIAAAFAIPYSEPPPASQGPQPVLAQAQQQVPSTASRHSAIH